MGRKIPAKKHHGAKNPEEQQKRRFEKIKMKINEPPTDPDEQEIPRKLKMIMKAKETLETKRMNALRKTSPATDHKKDKFPSKKQTATTGFQHSSSDKPQHGMERPLKPIPVFQKLPGESDKAFLWRTELISQQFLKKVKFENKYDVDVIPDPETGEVKVLKRDNKHLEKDLGPLPDKPAPKSRRQEKKMKKQQIEAQARKEEKKQKRKEREKSKKGGKKEVDEFAHLQEKIAFGDIVHEPPCLSLKPRKSVDSSSQDRPGRRDLLLKQSTEPSSSAVPQFRLSGKRRDLPWGERRRLEEERHRTVALYRNMKKEKLNQKIQQPVQRSSV